jgi:hypothetical protein
VSSVGMPLGDLFFQLVTVDVLLQRVAADPERCVVGLAEADRWQLAGLHPAAHGMDLQAQLVGHFAE